MSDFRPDTERVRESYLNGEFNDGAGRDAQPIEFDLWLENALAVAWDRGYSTAMNTAMTTEQFQDDSCPCRRYSEPSERSRCGEPHPHYSSMSCGREPGHDDAHSYGVPTTQPIVQDHTNGSMGA